MTWNAYCRQNCRIIDKSVDGPTLFGGTGGRLALPRLELFEALAQEPRFVGVAHGAALEQPAEHDARRLELVHVLEDEDLHLPRPERDVDRSRVALDRGAVA